MHTSFGNWINSFFFWNQLHKLLRLWAIVEGVLLQANLGMGFLRDSNSPERHGWVFHASYSVCRPGLGRWPAVKHVNEVIFHLFRRAQKNDRYWLDLNAILHLLRNGQTFERPLTNFTGVLTFNFWGFQRINSQDPAALWWRPSPIECLSHGNSGSGPWSIVGRYLSSRYLRKNEAESHPVRDCPRI